MPEICDVAYALLVERVFAETVADRQALIVARALGAEVEIPDVDVVLADFHEALNAEPKAVDRDQDLMLRGLGLRR